MSKAHVLIVDDNMTGIQVLAGMLGALDVSYISLNDPTKLAAMVDDLRHVDVIFLDLEMPKIDGYEMLQILKDDLKIDASIIAYSVHTSEMGTAKQLGFDGYLGKPLRMSSFPIYLDRILNGEEVWEVD